MTGLPMSLLGLRYYSVFKTSEPRPLGGAVPVADPLGAKQNPLTRVGRRYLPNLLGATLSPPRFSTRFRSSARGVYHQPPGCQSLFGGVRGAPSVSEPTHAPRLSAGLAPYAKVCFPTVPGLPGAALGCRRARIIAPLLGPSSGPRKIFRIGLSAERRGGRSGVSPPAERCRRDPKLPKRAAPR